MRNVIIAACLLATPAWANEVLLHCQGETATVATKVSKPHVTNIPIAQDGSWIGITKSPRVTKQNKDVWFFRDENPRYKTVAEYTFDPNILSLFVAHSKQEQGSMDILEWVERVWCTPVQNPFMK